MVDIIILTAIALEFNAVMEVEDGAWPNSEWRKDKTRIGLPIAFRMFKGRQNRPLHVAVTQAAEMGAVAATTALLPLALDYGPSCVAMAGVCAGRPGKTNLGDVIAAERLFFHDSGKQLPTKEQQDLTTYNLRPDWKLAIEHLDFGARFQKESWWKNRPITYEWQENWVLAQLNAGKENPALLPECKDLCPNWKRVIDELWKSGHVKNGTRCLTEEGRRRIESVLIQHRECIPDLSPSGTELPFKVHVAPMGSGNKVIENENIWGFISEHMRKTLGLEMEAAAIGAIAQAMGPKGPDALVMKGVMDFADNHRDDHFKEFAARASAECLIAFMREHVEPKADEWSETPLTTPTLAEIANPAEANKRPAIDRQSCALVQIRRPPAKPVSRGDHPKLPQAQCVAVAALLGSLLHDEHSFRRACAEAGLPGELFWAATSPSDRWFSAIVTAIQSGVSRRLMEAAVAALPPVLRWRLEVTDTYASTRAPRWDRGKLYEHRMAILNGRVGSNAGDPDILGWRMLRQLWGTGKPDLAALHGYLYPTVDRTSSVAEEKDHGSRGEKDVGELELGMAAEHLFAWCESVGGDQLLAWTLDHVNRLSASRFAVITAAVRWWDNGREKLKEAARAMRDQRLDQLPRRSIDLLLSRLSALDRLLCEADAAWWALTESPPSVQLAIRAGRLSSVAELLEAIGEQRPIVFIEHLARFHHDRDAVVALARALRRLRIAGLKGDPADPDLSLALHCSLPEATADEIAALITQPRKRAWWFDLLSPPLLDFQIGALIEIQANARHLWERDRARKWLCTTLDPMVVWRRLTASARRQWIEELTEFELVLMGPLVDQRPPEDASERQDWTRLQERVVAARHAAH